MRKKKTKEEFEFAAKNSKSIAGMCRLLDLNPSGGNYRTLNNVIEKYKIEIDGNEFTLSRELVF